MCHYLALMVYLAGWFGTPGALSGMSASTAPESFNSSATAPAATQQAKRRSGYIIASS